MTLNERKNYDLLIKAINDKRAVRFYYKSNTSDKYRICYPFLIGITSDDNLSSRMYYLENTKFIKYDKNNWRIYKLNDIKELVILSDEYNPKLFTDYNSKDEKFKKILYCI